MLIKNRFILYFSLLFLIVGAVSAYSIQITRIIDRYLESNLPLAIEEVQKSSRLDITAQLIRYDDEVLTQSARNYAFTGDVKWKERYFEFIPKLDLRIEEVLAGADTDDRNIFSGIQAANSALVDLETSAIAYVDAGDLMAAQNILDSDDYAKHKNVYKDGINRYLAKRGASFNSAYVISTAAVEDSRNELHKMTHVHTRLMVLFTASFFWILIFLIYLIFKTFMVPLNHFRGVAKKITGGDLRARVDIKKKDEISDFAADFNKMTGTLNDALKNTEQKVRERTAELEKFKLAVDNTSNHIVITDNEGLILYANQAVEEITGYSVKEIIGKKAGSKELWGGLMALEFYELMWKTIKQDKKTFIGEVNNRRKKGEDYVALASISPVLGSNSKVEFFVGIERDITKEKEIEMAKSQFVSLASHQLRTPLTSIRWLVEILTDKKTGPLNKTQKEFLFEMQESTNRLIMLVRDLLNVSRIETGRLKINPQPTDLVALSQDIFKELAIQIKDKKIKLKKSFPKSFPKISIDPLLLRQVILNLLSNSIKYTQEKGEIAFSLEKKNQDALFSVSDSGIGIPKADHGKIFERFFRASNVHSANTEGTGLGPFMAKYIVDISGGQIGFDSQENKGTKFWFTVPLKGTMVKKEGVSFGE